MLSIFLCVCWPSVCLLWRSVYLCLCLFFFDWVFFFFFLYWAIWAICVFWRWSLCQLLHLKILSPILRVVLLMVSLCLFVLLMVFFGVQKLLSLIRSYLLTFVFIFIKWKGGSRKILLLNWCTHIIIPLGFENFLASSTKWCLRLSLSSYYKLGISNFSKEPWSLLVKNDI